MSETPRQPFTKERIAAILRDAEPKCADLAKRLREAEQKAQQTRNIILD